jgi:hypothetical protein
MIVKTSKHDRKSHKDKGPTPGLTSRHMKCREINTFQSDQKPFKKWEFGPRD